jgi:hypothetical protein
MRGNDIPEQKDGIFHIAIGLQHRILGRETLQHSHRV